MLEVRVVQEVEYAEREMELGDWCVPFSSALLLHLPRNYTCCEVASFRKVLSRKVVTRCMQALHASGQKDWEGSRPSGM